MFRFPSVLSPLLVSHLDPMLLMIIILKYHFACCILAAPPPSTFSISLLHGKVYIPVSTNSTSYHVNSSSQLVANLNLP